MQTLLPVEARTLTVLLLLPDYMLWLYNLSLILL